jgi:hypothetical protein
MVQYVITPWRHQSELIEVREKLYGNAKNVEAMRDAVDLVGVWSESVSLLIVPYFSLWIFSFETQTCYFAKERESVEDEQRSS